MALDKKGALATFDALTFFMIALIVSLVITVAVMEARDTQDLRQTRQRMDETAYSLSVIVQYSIRVCTFTNSTEASFVLKDRTVLNLLCFCLTNLELNLSYGTGNIKDAIDNELMDVLNGNYQLMAFSRNQNITVPDAVPPSKEIITTSLTAPASEDLGGEVRIVLAIW